MYDDDLSDILPRLPTRQPALSSFNDDHDDPFKNPFNSGSDPWATYGQTSSSGLDDWNQNVFADMPSRGQPVSHQDEAPPSPEALQSHQEEQYLTEEREVGQDGSRPTSEAVGSLQATPTSDKAGVVDPLDAALSNLEEDPEHVPVFKRKLPLVVEERRSSIAEPTPTTEDPLGPKEPVDAATSSIEPKPMPVLAPNLTPTQDGPSHSVDERAAATPTLLGTEIELPTEAPASTSSTPGNVSDMPPAQQVREIPSSSPSTTSLPEDNQATPPHTSSREPSMSDIESKALNKVVISPLERTPAMQPNPLDRNYSAPASIADVGGWGDAWNPGSGSGFGRFGESIVESRIDSEIPSTTVDGQEDTKETEEEDPEDNVPLAQSLSNRPPVPSHMYQITVGDPQKVGDPISAHIIYTVHTRTTNPNYKKSEFSVLRRYSDFAWLYDTLCANNPGVIVPPIPEKNSLGRFQEAFVEARRLALNKCIQKIANHPGLCNDKDLQLFLESDNFALDIKHRRGEESGGLLSVFSTSIAGSKFYETDEWFETKRVYLDGLENQLKGLVRSMEAVSKQRTEFSTSLAELAETLEALSTCDISRQLSGTFVQLAALQRKAKEWQDEQAQQDMVTFVGTVEEYGRMISSVRLAFASRVKCFGQWQTAESDMRRAKANYEKARKQSKTPERLHYHMQEVADAERKAVHTKSEFERVTKLLKVELHRFDMERVEDFKRSLEAFLDGMIRRQKELVHTWEEYQSTLLQRSQSNPTANGSDTNAETSTVASAA